MTENWLLDLTIEVFLLVRSGVWIGRCLVGVRSGGSGMFQLPGRLGGEESVSPAQTGAWRCGGSKKPCSRTRLASFVMELMKKSHIEENYI